MREKIRDKERLKHILDTINILLDNRQNDVLLQLKDNPIVFHGFVKNVEIIGEAAYMLSKEFKSSHDDVNWRGIEGMRHVLVHGYYRIEPSRLWKVVENEISELEPTIRRYYLELEEEEKKKVDGLC